MTQALGIETEKTMSETEAPLEREQLDQGAQKGERSISSFLSELRRMTPEERIRASRYSMTRHECFRYAAAYPDEAPTVNGEFEWIALTLE